MIEKLQKPIRFDKEVEWLVVARDGEKFFVAKESNISEDDSIDLLDLKSKSLLQWALEFDYPLRKFVKLQKTLVQKFFGS
jgi:hypothetical protein